LSLSDKANSVAMALSNMVRDPMALAKIMLSPSDEPDARATRG
jgi:hypothetical protein